MLRLIGGLDISFYPAPAPAEGQPAEEPTQGVAALVVLTYPVRLHTSRLHLTVSKSS